jgi:hypothetical protein
MKLKRDPKILEREAKELVEETFKEMGIEGDIEYGEPYTENEFFCMTGTVKAADGHHMASAHLPFEKDLGSDETH